MSLRRFLLPVSLRHVLRRWVSSPSSSITYFQGQLDEGGQREYFYYIDHQGMLFLDDAKMKNFTSGFKEKNFLRFFFRRLRRNELSGKYGAAFPFVSPCGPEINYVRCDDIPIVFTNLMEKEDTSAPRLSFNHGGKFLTAPFVPAGISMDPETGRVYHPAMDKVGGVGLIADKLSIQWTKEKRFDFGLGEDRPPTTFHWNGEDVRLEHKLVPKRS